MQYKKKNTSSNQVRQATNSTIRIRFQHNLIKGYIIINDLTRVWKVVHISIWLLGAFAHLLQLGHFELDNLLNMRTQKAKNRKIKYKIKVNGLSLPIIKCDRIVCSTRTAPGEVSKTTKNYKKN